MLNKSVIFLSFLDAKRISYYPTLSIFMVDPPLSTDAPLFHFSTRPEEYDVGRALGGVIDDGFSSDKEAGCVSSLS